MRAELLGGVPGPALIVPVHGSIARGTLLVADPVGRDLAPRAQSRSLLLAAHTWAASSTRASPSKGCATPPTAGCGRRHRRADRRAEPRRLRRAGRRRRTPVVAEPAHGGAGQPRPHPRIIATFGHQVGDHLLTQFGARLRDGLPVTWTVARLGGDEFAVLLCELRDQEKVSAVASDPLEDVTRPYTEATQRSSWTPAWVSRSRRCTLRTPPGSCSGPDIAMEAAKSARSHHRRPGRAEAILEDLHHLGVRLSVDDFGTGYSSLAHLLRLPVDEIKVDQSFVSGLLSRRGAAAIVRATIDLGRRLAMTVTAEGVEDRETWNELAELGCHLGRGFWFARPVDPCALERWITGTQAVATATATDQPMDAEVRTTAA